MSADLHILGGQPQVGKAAFVQFFQALQEQERVQAECAEKARPALGRLVHVCAQKTGQSYKLRALLYSLWNGQPASLLEIITLDWAVREDLLMVLRAFGFEAAGLPAASFFYDSIQEAVAQSGLWEWFLAEAKPLTAAAGGARA